MHNKTSSNHFNNKITIVTGELSGEIHAYNVIKKLRESLDVEFWGIGSKKLEGIGVRIIDDYKNISLVGLHEIFSKLKHIWIALHKIKIHIRETRPSLVILVDFPGFNMRVAKYAKKYGSPVIYFIPPQIWAWRKKRIIKIKKFINKVICILPFEKRLYDEYNVDSTYVGHPFMDNVRPVYTRDKFLEKMNIKGNVPIITIMPGSRSNEIEKHMPVLIKTVGKIKDQLKELTVLLPLADNIEQESVSKFNTGNVNITYVRGLAYDALSCSDIAIIASGSATLEAAILGVPAIVIYKISRFSYMMAKRLVKVKHISLPNIIAKRELYPEFVQHLDPELIAEKALHMLNNGSEEMKKELSEIKIMFENIDSYELAKNAIMEFLKQTYGTVS